MSLGASLFDLLNPKSPKQAVLAESANQPSVPPDPGATGTVPDPGAAAPTNAQPNSATMVANGQTPPDLAMMYSQLVKRQEAARGFDSGLTTIAAGLAQQQNRAALLNMAAQEDTKGVSSPEQIATSLMNLQKYQTGLDVTRAQAARLPAIAKQYNLPLETVQYLNASGKLDETLNALAQPHTSVQELADGSKILIDDRTGKRIADIGPAKKVQPTVYERADGSRGYYDPYAPGDKEKAGEVAGAGPMVKKELMTRPDQSVIGYDPYDPGNKDKQVEVAGRMVKPEIKEMPNGDQYEIDPYNPADQSKWKLIAKGEPKWDIKAGPQGELTAVDPRDPTRTINVGQPSTADIVNYDKARKESPDPSKFMGFPEWLISMKKAGASSTNVTLGAEKAGAEAAARKYVDSMDKDRDLAQSSNEAITAIQNAQRSLDDPAGMITGDFTKPYVLAGRKVIANTLGLDDKAAENTDLFNSNIRTIVLPQLKKTGSGAAISNTDRTYVDQMLGGSGDISPEAIKRILVIQEKIERHKIFKYNQEVDKKSKEDPDMGKYLRRADEPPPSQHLLSMIPQKAIEKLRGEPKLKRDFDLKYGTGMADYFLGPEAQ